MNSFSKFVKSVHVESQVLSAMIVGYVVLLVVSATIIVNSHNGAEQSSRTATTGVQSGYQMNN